jgi:hypothetical protein
LCQSVAFFYGPDAYHKYYTQGVKMGDLLKTATMKMYLAGWNHYPEGEIRNALYLHLLEGSEAMEWDKTVTVAVRSATEDGIRQVS